MIQAIQLWNKTSELTIGINHLSSSIRALNYSLHVADTQLWNKTSELTARIRSTADELRSSIDIRAANLTSELHGKVHELKASTDTTAAQFRSEINGLHTKVSQLNSKIEGTKRELRPS